MTVFVALLRAVNVGGNNTIKMADLKDICEKVGFGDVTTLLQSGNVAFTAKQGAKSVAGTLADAIEKGHGLRLAIMIRTDVEIADAMKRNPFRVEEKSDPGHLIIGFLGNAPDSGAKARLAAVKVARERLNLSGRELFAHYADGIGKSKVTNAVLEKALGVPVTARNWNTVTKLLAIAESIG